MLNVCAVGLALAAVVSASAIMMGGSSTAPLGAGLPTWVIGTLWAWLLRWPRTVGKSAFRWGWVASVPLAMSNGALACAFLLANTRRWPGFVACLVLGATVGIIAWLPALVLTLFCFGLPIASAHRLGAAGLAGEERGERVVGVACFVMSALGLGAAALASSARASAGLPLTFSFAILGLITGGSAALLAHAREARRRRFVARVEAGEVPGYRIDPTAVGKVLVRIVSRGEGYRVTDFEEEVFDLGAAGEATRAKAEHALGRAPWV